MPEKLPSIIVTGASGIVGKSFVDAAKEEFLIYALARRSQKEAGIPVHPNIKWIQVDIANWISLRWVMHHIKRSGGVDYILHLAAYYDFNYDDHPEYERTNVKGTRYMLEQAKILRIKRFIFASSTAACNFPAPGTAINEKTPADANFAYAIAKRKGEEMVKEFSRWFSGSVVRFAAVYTDWCEYGVLYMLLESWLANKWDSKILGGKGNSAVPYIHSHDLNELIFKVLRHSNQLPQFDTYIASPDGSTSHREIFERATRFFYGKNIRPYFIPKIFAYPGIIIRNLLGHLVGKPPFIQPWMLKYLDYKLNTEAKYTREALSWQPTPRYHILRRILFLIEKMKNDPLQWHSKNSTALKRIYLRPNLLIYETMIKCKEEIVTKIKKTILDSDQPNTFSQFQALPKDDFDWYINTIFQLFSSSIRINDRIFLLDYIKDLSIVRFKEGFSCREICDSFLCIENIIKAKLIEEPELKNLTQDLHDKISITLQMMLDEVESAFENYSKQESISKKKAVQEIDNKLNQMENFYQYSENDIEDEEEFKLE